MAAAVTSRIADSISQFGMPQFRDALECLEMVADKFKFGGWESLVDAHAVITADTPRHETDTPRHEVYDSESDEAEWSITTPKKALGKPKTTRRREEKQKRVAKANQAAAALRDGFTFLSIRQAMLEPITVLQVEILNTKIKVESRPLKEFKAPVASKARDKNALQVTADDCIFSVLPPSVVNNALKSAANFSKRVKICDETDVVRRSAETEVQRTTQSSIGYTTDLLP